MSEEDYYIDVLNNDEEENLKKKDSYEWDSEPVGYQEPSQDFYQEEQRSEQPYQQEFYGEGYYQDYQAPRRPRGPPEKGPPWFWIGVLVAAGVSAVVMVLFNFIGAYYRPGLAYLEAVILLACTTLPGLFVRKVKKGILGGFYIFALQFFIPVILFYSLGRDPANFFSPYFLFLNALGLIENGYDQISTFSIIPTNEILDYIDEYKGYLAFVWIFDLLIMFGVMLSLVIASSWLTANLFTQKVKNFWTWFLLPGQAIVIILNLAVIPWLLLSFSSITQTGGALAAGAANVAEVAMPFIDGNFTGIDDLSQFSDMLYLFDNADEWFSIAKSNYEGLRDLFFFRLLTKVSGRYGFIVSIFNSTIFAGFELLKALNPLAHAMFDSTNNTGTEVDGFYYQYEDFMGLYDDFSFMFNTTAGGSKPSETQLASIEDDVGVMINDIDYLLDRYMGSALDSIDNAQSILFGIDPNDLRNVGGNTQVEDVLNQVADGLDNVLNITNEYSALIPIAKDLFLNSPHLFKSLFNMLVGNVRLLLGYQFEGSSQYFLNASAELQPVIDIFSDARRNDIVASNSATALGFFDFFRDVINITIPIISLEGNIAGTVGNIINALDEYVAYNGTAYDCDMSAVNFTAVFDYMDKSIEFSDYGVANGTQARLAIDAMNYRANNSQYSLMSGAAYSVTQAIDSVFQPYVFAQVLSNMSRSINSIYRTSFYIYINDEASVQPELDNASANIDYAINIVNAHNDTPISALSSILTTFKTTIDELNSAIASYMGGPIDINLAVPVVEDIFLATWTNIHVIIDDGLPP
ncbi:MAG: hypothetical protein FK734_10890 [Asgard group archaeon]|nr:hypothetical protein [Asgard group archaeon]